MSENIEIEFKNLLIHTEYQKLFDLFELKQVNSLTQENFYFDTAEAQLAKHNAGLRIRILPDKAEQTLKTPYGEHLLETNDDLSLEEAKKLVQHGTIQPNGHIAEKLVLLAVPINSLEIIGHLKTIRYQIKVPQGLFVLDESFYGKSGHDYELEFETHNAIEGEKFFLEFLTKNNIRKRPIQNKIQRMLKESNKKTQ